MNFPKDEGVGDWKSGHKFEMGRAPFSGKKNVFKFSWERKHQKRPLFPHATTFHLPSQFGLRKIFLETQLDIHSVASKVELMVFYAS